MTNKIKILIVDDEDDTLKIVETLLRNEGYDVIAVPNAKSALMSLKKISDISLCIIDIMMPGTSGWKLFNKIKKIDEKMKVIMLSILKLNTSLEKELYEGGIKDYINKPIDNVDFIKRVKKALN